MSIRIDNRFGTSASRAPGAKSEPQPPALAAAVAKYEQDFRHAIEADHKAADALLAEASKLDEEAKALRAAASAARAAGNKAEADQKLLDSASKARLAAVKRSEAADKREAHTYVTSRVSGTRGRDLLFETEGGQFKAADAREAFESADAGHAKVAASNATLWLIHFPYHTSRAMAGFLTDLPADGKLTLNVICTPSAHAGREETAAEAALPTPAPGTQRANYESFARTNQYVAEVIYRDPNGRERTLQRLQFGVKNGPEYASMSPDISVDLTQLQGGRLIVQGYAIGSAGVGGYVEARRTEIELPLAKPAPAMPNPALAPAA